MLDAAKEPCDPCKTSNIRPLDLQTYEADYRIGNEAHLTW